MEITLKLPVDKVNTVLQALAAQPYGAVADLVAEIKQQAEAQVAAAQQPKPEVAETT